ncbi:hypothetical protein HYU50_00835, partial [Candidatus Woesearchaeota archaeon]|nr:hypothetical protein [Candidatus Woesearchaeota archaeon]
MLLEISASKPGNLAQITAEEFRGRFSTGEGFFEGDAPIKTRIPLRYAPNETQIAENFKGVANFLNETKKSSGTSPRICFYGVIGGVDLTLSYTASIWKELGRAPARKNEGVFLTDINECAIDYLNQRLDIFARSDNLTGYFRILSEEIPEAKKKLANYQERLKDEDRAHLWFSQESGFRTLKEMAESGSIKPFQSNYYGKGQGIFADLMDSQSPDAAIFYLSDIANVASNRKRHGGLKSTVRNSVIIAKLVELDIPFLIAESDIKGRNYMSLAG